MPTILKNNYKSSIENNKLKVVTLSLSMGHFFGPFTLYRGNQFAALSLLTTSTTGLFN
jgi:hypothetical protein